MTTDVSRPRPNGPIHVAAVYGTRPEAVKIAPVVIALRDDPRFHVSVAVTGQHREMLDQVHRIFGIVSDVDLDIHLAQQGLAELTARALTGVAGALERLAPDVVLVQGDTTTTLTAALAAFYHRKPVVHLEAGLRTVDRYSPFPEEVNRRLTTQLASLHLAPTATSAENLLREGVPRSAVLITGNTVIDALLATLERGVDPVEPVLRRLRDDPNRRMLLVTVHRRESWGLRMNGIGRALARIAADHPDVDLLFPIHRNPIVRHDIVPALQELPNAYVIEPLDYRQFAWAMARSHFVITDSGGIQEEAPSLGKPVLVLRDNTERPEAVTAGTVQLVGTQENDIVAAVRRLLADADTYAAMARAINPYGDGRAAGRVVEALGFLFGLADRPTPFVSDLPLNRLRRTDVAVTSARADRYAHNNVPDCAPERLQGAHTERADAR